MCGIAGALSPVGVHRQEWTRRLEAMASSIAHRGPDDQGCWVDPRTGVGLAHRRLSILDVSPAGRQPMISATGRFIIVYNGEIYNFRSLREKLSGDGLDLCWKSHSDTEVILMALECWGPERTLQHLDGIFAFGVWDVQERRLLLARDRLGVKPLYYGVSGGTFLFASELKALRAFPGFEASVDRGALALLMRHHYIPAPHSIHLGAKKLLPGRLLRVEPASRDSRGWNLRETTYWSARECHERAWQDPFRGSMDEASLDLEGLLRRAVTAQMVSDVPLGAFLSGGIDSSVVVALMQEASSRPVKTFSIGFQDPAFDEAPYARAVAGHLGTDHTELYLSAEDGLSVVGALSQVYDEPFSDASQIPTFLLSRLTRKQVTVSLSGDGGDELFCGYSRYLWSASLWKWISHVPWPMRRHLAAAALRGLCEGPRRRLLLALLRGLPDSTQGRSLMRRLERALGLCCARDAQQLYLLLLSSWTDPSQVVLGAEEPRTPYVKWASVEAPTYLDWMTLTDLCVYLPDDILTKLDRASMAVGLEARVPFLDHHVVEFAARLPMSLKTKGKQGKRVLRRILERHLPANLFERPKKGFSVPLAEWLRGPLRNWADELLDPVRLRSEGYFDVGAVRQRWEEHRSGRQDWHSFLWNILSFQAWLESLAHQSSSREMPG